MDVTTARRDALQKDIRSSLSVDQMARAAPTNGEQQTGHSGPQANAV